MHSKHKGYYFVFSSHFDRDKGIDVGRLLLEHIDRGHQQVWKAWSSHARGQKPDSIHQKGGYLPPAYRVPLIASWQVETNPIDLKHVRGVGGNFYRILPYKVKTDRGATRGDFGIHLDANVPGSAGCIVSDKKRFSQIENTMTRLRSEGVTLVPLNIIYS